MVVQIPDLYDCVETPSWISSHLELLVFLGLLVAGALVFLAYRAYTRYCESSKPYWDVALRKLAAINLADTSSSIDEKRFYGDLTHILKWYCCNRYGWFLSNKTDNELVHALREVESNIEILDALEKCMHMSVQVKFARVSVSPELAEADKQVVVSFIERSIPIHN